MRKLIFLFGFWLGVALFAAGADTFSFADGGSVAGEIVKFDDGGIMIHTPEETYTNVPWGRFSQDALKAHAPAALAALDAALPAHDELARLAALWRPRLLVLADRKDELTGEQTVVLRFEERLRDIKRGMAEAEAAGDEDAREALHAKYIEVGTTYAGRLAAREQ